jgi:hypothetical protein
MFALVNLADHSLPDVPHEPYVPQCREGFAWWPIETGRPSFNRKADVCVPGDLYADPSTLRVRRLWIVREKTPYELAAERGLHHLKMLNASDQGMVRALEDAVLVLLAKSGLTLDDLPETARRKFQDREAWRGQIR